MNSDKESNKANKARRLLGRKLTSFRSLRISSNSTRVGTTQVEGLTVQLNQNLI